MNAPAPSHLFILTGASRGMGLAMAQQLLQPEHTLLCLSRRPHATLPAQAEAAGTTLLQWSADLADSTPVARQLGAWLREQGEHRWRSATLINNAGMIPPIAPLSQSDPAELAQALRVGLEAPMALTAAFLGATEDWRIARKVLNISSGMGRNAMASQAAYCAAKAGMDHFSRSVALDEARKPHGARVCSLAPGVIDTDMQKQLRSADPARFPDVGRFAGLHDNRQLTSPEEAAARVLAWMRRADFGQEVVADVRNG